MKVNIDGRDYQYGWIDDGVVLNRGDAVIIGPDGVAVPLREKQANALLSGSEEEVNETDDNQHHVRRPPRPAPWSPAVSSLLTSLKLDNMPVTARDTASQVGWPVSRVSSLLLDLTKCGYVSREKLATIDDKGQQRLIYHYTLTHEGHQAIGS